MPVTLNQLAEGGSAYVGFRASVDLKRRLEVAAAVNGRSLSTEVQFRLEASLRSRSAFTEALLLIFDTFDQREISVERIAAWLKETLSLSKMSDETATHTIAVSEPRKIEELELFARTSNALKNAGIQTVEDLAKRSPAELLRIPNFGRLALNDVRQRLNENGVTWP